MGRYELEPDKDMERRNDRNRRMKSPVMDSRPRRRDSPAMMVSSRGVLPPPPPMPRETYEEPPYMSRPKPDREHIPYKILCVGMRNYN